MENYRNTGKNRQWKTIHNGKKINILERIQTMGKIQIAQNIIAIVGKNRQLKKTMDSEIHQSEKIGKKQ